MNTEKQSQLADRDREHSIAHHRNYCRHYTVKPGANVTCAAGMDIKSIQRVATKPSGLKWGPCIEGHTLQNPCAICSKWDRPTREEGEKHAELVAASLKRVNAWRKKLPIGKREVVECPACKGKLHLSQAACNGHVRGICETENCLNWIE